VHRFSYKTLMKFRSLFAVAGMVIFAGSISACDAISRATILANEKCYRKPDPSVATACAYGVRLAEINSQQIKINPLDPKLEYKEDAQRVCEQNFGSRLEIAGCVAGIEAFVQELRDQLGRR